MHDHMLDKWTHDHVFLGEEHARNERRTFLVVGITIAMMIAEIIGGTLFGSMALLADGWHMSTHAAAIGIAAFAYRYARSHAHDPRFSFGTGKLGELAAFTSAVVLAMVALGIAYESVLRITSPQPIAYAEAIGIAVLGLLVNLACAWLLRDDHSHHHDHDHDHDHDGKAHAHHGDNNMRAAYVHVLADAATSVLAIVALLLARSFGWVWVDPLVGLIGAGVIASWSIGLMRDSGAVLIDVVPKGDQASAIRKRLEIAGDRVSDLHVWQIGPGHQSAIVTIVTDDPQPAAFYKARLAGLRSLSHVTIEVAHCRHSDGECGA
ncbi:MAG: cation transporter [Tardiphaga sp.]|nr:cation transporter [Tardiphaga sp.]